MQKTQIKYTYSDYLLLPEEDRRELIDGVFYVVPSPNFRHQTIIYYLGRLLADFVEENSLGTLRWAPLDVKLSDYDVVQPDILFVSKDRRHTIAQNFISAAPDLAIEVLSPSTQDRDKELKLKLYAEFGVFESTGSWTQSPSPCGSFNSARRATTMLRMLRGAFHLRCSRDSAWTSARFSRATNLPRYESTNDE